MKLTKEIIEQIEADYNCHNVKIINDYITAIYDAPSNPENIGERVNIIDRETFESEYQAKNIQFYRGYNLMNEKLPFNWDNTDFNMASKSHAELLANANDKFMKTDQSTKAKEQIWKKLCEDKKV